MADTKKNYTSGYDPAKDEEYQKALKALSSARENKPVYSNTYGPQAESLLGQIQNRKPFAYDINTDALYQQYREQYQGLGRRAMADTMGRAQAMTGGYGNSYAQTVGQQAYQGHLGKLSEVVPTLYDQALARYKQEGQALQDKYEQTKQLEQEEYGRHKDALDAYRKDLSFLQTQADQAYSRGYQSYLQGYQMAQDQYTKLLHMMNTLGYKPTEEELLAAGLTKNQAAAFLR